MLSPRLTRVVALIVRGYTNKRIAAELGLTVGTVKQYTVEIGRRIDGPGHPRMKAFRWWYESGANLS